MKDKTIIIVPYRNREDHLDSFLTHMNMRYADMHICIVQQSYEKPFNRGKLLNIGFLENPEYARFVFHDVDMLPIDVLYTTKYTLPIVQLARSSIQLFDYLGGVTRFSKLAFNRVGGYNNEYYHRAEDNEMMFNLKRLGMNVIKKPCKFHMLDHERKGPEFDPALWQKAQQVRNMQDQLSICCYELLNTSVNGNVKHITVSL